MTIEFVNHSTVELIKHNASDDDVALAAWVSNFSKNDVPVRQPGHHRVTDYYWYKNTYGQAGADKNYPDVAEYLTRISGLINFLYREKHMSPFEHGSFTFYVDTPIFVAREFMRHRTFSYNETSGRYKELSPRFYLIDSDRPVVQKGKVGAYEFDNGSDDQYGTTFAATQIAYETAWKSYQTMLDKGVAREVARNVLPVGIMTQFYATANPRNVMQFLDLRNDGPALHEIRQVAVEIEKHFATAMPLTYQAYKNNDWREAKAEVEDLRRRVNQLEAEISYSNLAGEAIED